MKRILVYLFFIVSTAAVGQTTTSHAWINEFHYDGITQYGQTDSNEFVEVVVRSTIATDPLELAKYKLVLYTSGAYDTAAWTTGRGVTYSASSLWYSQSETEHPLSGFTACPVIGNAFTLLSKPMPILQDVPAAIALVYENTVIQLLSYERVFKIAPANMGGGPAAGQTTEIISNMLGLPAMETASTPNTHSVSLIGTGVSYSDFMWDDGPTVMATPCAVNSNGITVQTFAAPLPVRWLHLSATGARESIFVNWQVATETGVSNYEVEVSDVQSAFTTSAQKEFDRNANGNYTVEVGNLNPSTYRVRIKSQMITGEVEYSETKLVRLSGSGSQLVSVYPNPVSGGKTQVTIIPAEKTAYALEVVDMNGKRVLSIMTAVLQPNTLNRIELPLKVPAGIYQLRVLNGHEQQSIKIVVM